MKFNFKKIASVLAGTVLMSSTLAFAAAANYPSPYVQGGNSDVYVVYGSAPGAEFDLVAVADITTNLQASLAKQTATSGSGASTSVTGEAAPLFTSSSVIEVNDTLNAVKSSLTEAELPIVLKDGSFSGNVDATYTQIVTLGDNPRVGFSRMPTSSDDPDFGLALSTSTSSPVYNASVTFNKEVNFSHADSKGEELFLFGQKFTIGSSTDSTSLVLLKSAEKVSLTNTDPSATVTIGGKAYTVELVSASDNDATVKVTDADGNSDTKTISENASKKVQGLTVAITQADETNFQLSASVIAGAEKYTLTSGSAITSGENDDTIDGTKITFTGGSATPSGLTKMEFSVAAASSDADSIKPGQALVDPVFGTLKVDFASISAPLDSDSRESIKARHSGDDKLEVTLTDNRGNTKTQQYVKNTTGGAQLQGDNDGRNITVLEKQATYRNEFVVVGNEDEGRLLKVSTITNQTTGYSNDKVRFSDVFSSDTYEATLTAEGVGTVTIGGKVYDVNYYGASENSEDTRYVRLGYPDSSGAGSAVAYPTIQTSKGAKVAFYEPLVINISNWDGSSSTLTQVKLPDGDGFTDVAIVGTFGWNMTVGGVGINQTLNTNTTATVGKLTYVFTALGGNQTVISLRSPSSTTTLLGNDTVSDAALVIFEEKDEASNYQALVVTTEAGGSSDDGLGVSDVLRTWSTATSTGSENLRDTLASDSKIIKAADLFGSVITLDDTDSDQRTADISYPDEQINALVYVAANDAEIAVSGATGSGSVKELGSVLVKDSEVASLPSRNLIVVGGSCVNSEAARLLGLSAAKCGADFTTATGVGAGQFLIQSFSKTGGKVATLVAGYNAADTQNAAKVLTTKTDLDTTAGKKYTSTSATTVELKTTETTA